MTVTYFTNFAHPSNLPFSDEMYRLIGDDYTLVEIKSPGEAALRSYGTTPAERPYILRPYQSGEKYRRAMQLGLDSDVVIKGWVPEAFIRERLKADKLTFRQQERWMKLIGRHILNPLAWAWYLKIHTRFRSKKFYLLCTSAYAANDAALFCAYPGKRYKWGYFTASPGMDIEQVLAAKRTGPVRLLWCSRLIGWKHPELAVKLAARLKQKGYDFHLDMVGSGPLADRLARLAHRLGVEDRVTLLGNLPNDQVMQMMRDHHIFLHTSDWREGWGITLGEAMDNGCAAVASDKIGAAPFLVQDGHNGFMFRSRSLRSLVAATEKLMDDPALREDICRNARLTMQQWSPAVAASHFLTLADRLSKGEQTEFLEGPCSIAKPVYRRKGQ